MLPTIYESLGGDGGSERPRLTRPAYASAGGVPSPSLTLRPS